MLAAALVFIWWQVFSAGTYTGRGGVQYMTDVVQPGYAAGMLWSSAAGAARPESCAVIYFIYAAGILQALCCKGVLESLHGD